VKKQPLRNHLRAHRKKSGLSQRELALLLGYEDQGQVSRHERSETIPPLGAALAYEAVFRTPISALFLNTHLTDVIERKLDEMEGNLGQRDAKEPGAQLTAKKLTWLKGRKNR